MPHSLIEVFSVRFIDHSDRYISGNMRIELEDSAYYLFGPGEGDSCASCIEVDSQGYAILKPDSECPLNVNMLLSFCSELEKLKGKEDGLQALGKKKKKRLNIPFWDNRYESRGQRLWYSMMDRSDELICKQLLTQAGPIEIHYAVFVNAVEALVDVTLYNWRVEESEEPIQLYGKVTAKSSMIRKHKAKSILFQREKARNQYLSVYPSKQNVDDHISLPLSRHKVVLSRGSALKIYIDIWRCFGDADDRRVGKSKVELWTKPSKSSESIRIIQAESTIRTESIKIIQAENFDIQVKVKWVHDTRISEGDDSSEEDDA